MGCHRRAFESFGGVPHRIVPDNLKAAVVLASFDDPVLGEAYRRLAQHYGCLISPTRPRTPEHKGKVESGVHYVQRNFMAGQQFADIDIANERLRVWVSDIAGTRHHGTTGQAPLAVFRAKEQAALFALPAEPFDLLEVRPVKVHQDCHVQIAGSFYSVPWRLVGTQLDVRIGERLITVYHAVQLVKTQCACAVNSAPSTPTTFRRSRSPFCCERCSDADAKQPGRGLQWCSLSTSYSPNPSRSSGCARPRR